MDPVKLKELCLSYSKKLEDIKFKSYWKRRIELIMINEDDWLEYLGLHCAHLKASDELDKLKEELNYIKKDIRNSAEIILCDFFPLVRLPILVSSIIVSKLHIYDLFDLFQIYEESFKNKSQ